MGRVIRSRAALVVAVVAAALFVAGSMLAALVGEDTARDDAAAVATPLAVLCDTDPAEALRVGANCPQARAIADGGQAPRDGVDGRGVLGTRLVGDRLVVDYDDGASQDVGPVVGPSGIGIAATTIETGRLVVLYSDGRRMDVGPVVGPSGVGIADVDGATGRLLVTLTSGAVIDAGPLPPGPRGDDGTNGENGADAPVQRGAVFRLGDGRTYVCDRTGGPDDFPEYDCPTPAAEPPPGPILGG